MSLNRRKVLVLFGAGATTALAGCGGGGSGDNPPPTRFASLLNLNPEFQSADIAFGNTTVGSALSFPGLTQRFEVEFGNYTVAVRDRTTGSVQSFDNVVVDDNSPSLLVFYRHFGSSRLGSSPPGIINYFDSGVALDVDLLDDAGNAQLETLPYETGVPQRSRSLNCVLRLFAAGSSVPVYDSGLQRRPDSILIFARYQAASASSGQVAVVALNYLSGSVSAVSWLNTLG